MTESPIAEIPRWLTLDEAVARYEAAIPDPGLNTAGYLKTMVNSGLLSGHRIPSLPGGVRVRTDVLAQFIRRELEERTP